jgi:general secretion pathway protein G
VSGNGSSDTVRSRLLRARHAVVRRPKLPRSTCVGRRRGGFTLIELLVVIAIVSVLAAVVAPAVFRNVGDAKQSAAKSQIELFATALSQYRLDNDAYPTTQQGLTALRTMPTVAEPPRNWRGPYLSRVVPLDPWGRPYVYLAPGVENPQTYDLYTLGRDGKPGGNAEDADVTSWGGAVHQ